jgi:hypothetical protein
MTLQEIIFDTACDDEESRLRLIDEILLDLNSGELSTLPKAMEDGTFILNHTLNDDTTECSLGQLLHVLRSVVVELMAKYRDAKTVCTILLNILRSHLSCITEPTFERSLRTIREYSTLNESPPAKPFYSFDSSISIY